VATVAFANDPLLPRPPGGNTQGALLAVLAHAGLLGALALGTQWRTNTPTDVSAELWAAVPQTAAQVVALPPPPTVVQPAPPALVKPVPPPPVQRDADIATERAKKEADKKELEKREAEKREADKKAQDKQQEEAEAKKRIKAEELKAWQAARAEEERLAKQREDNIRRMMGQAGDAAPPSNSAGTGTAAQNAAPSAGYAGRLKALILSNMVFTGAVEAASAAEVEVRAASGGTILSRRLVKSSGNSDWDEAVLRAIDRTGALPRDTDGRVPPVLTFVFRPRE
jgi:colicin import membrane protein